MGEWCCIHFSTYLLTTAGHKLTYSTCTSTLASSVKILLIFASKDITIPRHKVSFNLKKTDNKFVLALVDSWKPAVLFFDCVVEAKIGNTIKIEHGIVV